jgi:hypothetical protein
MALQRQLDQRVQTIEIADQVYAACDLCTFDAGDVLESEKELELRLVSKQLHTSVSQEAFAKLLQRMDESDQWEEKKPEITTMDHFFGDTQPNQRGTLYKDKSATLIEKTLEGRQVFDHAPSGYQLVLTAKRERALKSNYHSWPRPVMIRTKRRFSFLDQHVRCDLTIVFTNRTPESASVKPERTFEVEIELLPESKKVLQPYEIAATLLEGGLGLIEVLHPEIKDIYQGLTVLS